MLSENAHIQKRAARKSASGGRALLTGLVRCGRCGRMMRVFYGMRSGTHIGINVAETLRLSTTECVWAWAAFALTVP